MLGFVLVSLAYGQPCNRVTPLTISHNSQTECPGESWKPDPVMFINGPITLLASDRKDCFLWNQLGFSSFCTLKNLNWLCIKSKNCLTLWSHVGILFRVHWMVKGTLSLGLRIRMVKTEIPINSCKAKAISRYVVSSVWQMIDVIVGN